jgi:hypothetical protein
MVALVGSVMVHGGGSNRRNHLWREAVEEHHHHHLCGAIFVAGHTVGDDGIIDESITVPELCVSQCKGEGCWVQVVCTTTVRSIVMLICGGDAAGGG